VSAGALVDRAKEAGCGIAFSYSEPALALELTMAVAKIARRQSVPIVWKTNGFLTKIARRAAAQCLSAANVDLKCSDSKLHERLTGAPVAPVVETIRELVDSGIWVEVSTPVIPGISASTDELTGIADTVARIGVDIPWHVVRVSPEFRLSSDRPTNLEEMNRAVESGRRAGLRYIYVERALGAAGRATTCPACGLHVVERGVWNTERIELNDGRCGNCCSRIPGRW
jgi:pyruvate formate lyase activating enzyme